MTLLLNSNLMQALFRTGLMSILIKDINNVFWTKILEYFDLVIMKLLTVARKKLLHQLN